NGEPVSALSATVAEQAWRKLRKRPLVGTAIVLTACLAFFSGLALSYLEPSAFFVFRWLLWVASTTPLFFPLPDHRGFAPGGFCALLLAHVGWQSALPPRTPGDYPYQLGMAWIICATVLFFLLPSRPRDLAAAGFCSLAFGLAFIGVSWQGFHVDFLLHPIGV